MHGNLIYNVECDDEFIYLVLRLIEPDADYEESPRLAEFAITCESWPAVKDAIDQLLAEAVYS
jgi:hypothetical protein